MRSRKVWASGPVRDRAGCVKLLQLAFEAAHLAEGSVESLGEGALQLGELFGGGAEAVEVVLGDLDELRLRLLLLLKPPSLLKPLRLLRLLTRSNFSLLTKNGAMPRFFSPQNWGTKKGSRRSLFDNKQELLQLLI